MSSDNMPDLSGYSLELGLTVPDLTRKYNAFIRELKQTADERFCEGEVEGVLFRNEPSHFIGRGDQTEVSKILLGPEREWFGNEWTTIPWNFLKPMTTLYWVWVDQESKSKVCEILHAAKAGGNIEEDPYAEPKRYHVWCKSPEDVARIWKYMRSQLTRETSDAWKEKYSNRKTDGENI